MGTGIFYAVFDALRAELFFAVILAFIFALFSVCLFLSVLKTGYGAGKRAWYLIAVALAVSAAKARAVILGESDYSPIVLIFGLILYLPLFFIPVKGKAKDDEDGKRRELIRYIDKSMTETPKIIAPRVSPPAAEDGGTETLTAVPRTERAASGLDFSHVKNVLQRLEPATLSFADRKQIHDLELALFAAEHGDDTEDTRAKINAGLGDLLKIMAKHGV